MIYYEVNLQIQNEIFDDYMGWLKQHIDQMLKIAGFVDAKVYRQDELVILVSMQLTVREFCRQFSNPSTQSFA